MCASCYSLLLVLVTCLMGMVAEGLPLGTRQERGAHQDIIAGADFLSVLIDSSGGHERHEKMTTTTTSPTPLRVTLPKYVYRKWRKPMRDLRFPRSTLSAEVRSSTELSDSVKVTNSQETQKNFSDDSYNQLSAVNQTNTSLVVSVQVSSSEGDYRINKVSTDTKNLEITKKAPPDISQSNVIASEELPSIAAEINKSDFSVDESEPITVSTNAGLTQDYSTNVDDSQKFSDKDKFSHHSVVYHEPSEYGRARSVSYSTVIQSLPKTQSQLNAKEPNKPWVESASNYRERQERHFEINKTPNDNKFEDKNYKTEQNPTISSKVSSVAETNDYFVTAKYEPSENYPKQFLNKELWKKPEQGFIPSSTEKFWEPPGKFQPSPYIRPLDSKRSRIPMVYGKPEQNYEVDESVSVMSNGRVHGVQTNKIPLTNSPVDGKSDPNDNQKVGYVVEGRNYRKYRVEERTADGFIVGEYGVVSHDDGSLRGVRYTADGTINPRLIYDALMKFLSL